MRRRVLAGFLVGGWLLVLGSAAAALPATTGSAPATPGAEGPRLVRGEVTRVNEGRGTVTLKTPEGDVDLQLPAATVKGIRKGDRLTVRLGVHHPGASRRSAAGSRDAAGTKAP